MSIIKAQPEPQPAARFASVSDFLVSLGVPAANKVCQHTAHCHHEDVPTEVGTPKPLPETRTPSPITIAAAPGRLRSLFPPSNYGAVVPGSVYRSSYPQEKNYDFLKSIGVKTIMSETISPLSLNPGAV
jgi:tyrosine-protein phosphatase SIW14